MFIELSQRDDSVATVGDANMKLGRCVIRTKRQVEIEDRCRTSTHCSWPTMYNFLIRMHLRRCSYCDQFDGF